MLRKSPWERRIACAQYARSGARTSIIGAR